ncbi:oligogalacturonate-specific porin KdgM family protein [Enterobacillus tribolii]|uniref:Oligogalacturonate-specific porin n=1 Tax=Enterobacillus tribolii TaxID=1487935 RepID=A0A370QP56_9GAMM|nr:oligogalacturonate-specific porin KdgM family protein [Enterobacillus tribolii]MBW7981893.1 porin [Enterobacillus tribolii]RDK90088.1 oligogalacturonate-specific porin [Enterobacillus tribolii]
MKCKLIALAVTSLLSVNALAVTIDYRHEMRDTSKRNHADRLLISHRFANGFGLSSEVKWKSGDNKPDKAYNDVVSNGTEIVASYLYKFDDTYSLEGGMAMESSSSTNNYRPYLRPGIKFNKDLSATFRYRPYYKRVASGAGEDERGHQFNLVVSYNFLTDYTFTNEFEYKHAENAILWDGDKDDWLYEGKITYKWDKNWRPYAAIANVSGPSKYTDERQTRYRVGIQYVF